MSRMFVATLTVMMLMLAGVRSEAVTITQWYDTLPDPVPTAGVATGFTLYMHDFNRFDPSLGTLTAVRWTIASALSADVTWTNYNDDIARLNWFEVNLNSRVRGILRSGGTNTYNYSVTSARQDNSGAGWDLAVGESLPFIGIPAAGTSIFATFVNAGDLAAYTGINDFTVDLRGTGGYVASADTFVDPVTVSYFGDVLKLEYDYTPASAVPEPSTVLLLGAGLAGLGVFGRLRRKT